jgi:formylglycine-generating enzyme required for sulfatase activity
MSNDVGPYNLAAIRDLLLAAFTSDDLRRLFLYTEDRALRRVGDEFSPGDGLETMVAKTLTYCEKRALLAALLAEAQHANPDQYARFATRLGAPPTLLDSEEYTTARRRYLDALRERYNVVETHAFTEKAQDERVGSPRRLPLLGESGVYVPLRFDAPAIERELAPEEAVDQARSDRLAEGQQPLRLDQVLALAGHLALIGDAGCGKTTVLHVIASALAAEDPRAAVPDLAPVLPHPRPIPVLLPLRLFERACGDDGHPGAYRRCAADLLRFVDDWFVDWSDTSLPERFLADHLRAGRAWFLLDALDEVPDPTRRETVRNVIQDLAGSLPGTRLIVTARVAAYRGARLDDRFQVVIIRDLDEEQRTRMVGAIYSGLALAGADRRAADLAGRFQRSEALQDLARTPVMVWTAAVIHALRGELPEGRAALYDAYVDILLKQSFKRTRYDTKAVDELADGGGWPLPDRRHYLTYAAFQVHRLLEGHPERRGARSVVLGEEELADRVLAGYFQQNLALPGPLARQRAREFLTLMAERSGLLYESAQGYTLGDHLTMQEFLAGCYLGEHYPWEDREGYAAFLRDKVGLSWWQEVFMLAAGYLAEKPGFAARQFLAQIADQGEGPAAQLAALALAARGLLQLRARLRRPTWYDDLARRLANRLYERLYARPDAGPGQEAPPAAIRQEAALALGLLYGYPGDEGGLADPRFDGGSGLPAFVPIEAGWFWMGDDQGPEDERPCHRVYLDAYELARYPTTNAMFARFLDAGGYGDPRWWAEAIAEDEWRAATGFRRGNEPCYWDDARFNNPSQPVVGVSWYEAVAYCAWLSATLDDGYTYRLPTEAEWERAARGRPAAQEGPASRGKRYPWGEAWRQDHCNSKEAGLGAPSPVGLFPRGAADGGLEDMAGNVHEWCHDWYGEDYYASSGGARNPQGPQKGARRVLRGGSWWNEGAKFCRCGYRCRNSPGSWFNDWGFRCARASSS